MKISIIDAKDARENVKKHQLSAVLCLDSKNKEFNVIRFYKFAEEMIQRDSLSGRFDIEFMVTSEEPFEEVLNLDETAAFFEGHGYCIKFYDETTSDRARRIAGDGKYIMSTRIGW